MGPPTAVSEGMRFDYLVLGERRLSEWQRACALAHTLDVVWRPVLTSVGIAVRADRFWEASGVDAAVFMAIVTGSQKGRLRWRAADLSQMATATGIPAPTIASLNKHMYSQWEGVLLWGRELDGPKQHSSRTSG